MPPELFRWFGEVAATLSPALARDIAAVGPIWFPERADRGVAAFLARAVVGQQLSTKAARSIWARLEDVATDGGTLSELFHESQTATLRSCGLSANKAKALIRIGEAERGGELDAAAIWAMDHAARSAQLCRIWGIGQWTCDMLAIFYCRDPDVWPEGDLAVQRVFRRYLGRRKPSKAAALFAPYRSLLALYMWRLVDALPTT